VFTVVDERADGGGLGLYVRQPDLALGSNSQYE